MKIRVGHIYKKLMSSIKVKQIYIYIMIKTIYKYVYLWEKIGGDGTYKN